MIALLVAEKLALCAEFDARFFPLVATLQGKKKTAIPILHHDLADQLVHTAFRDMEAAFFEQVSTRLRAELTELIERVLGDHLNKDPE